MKGDAIAVVEAAYSLEGDDAGWLRGAVTALTDSFGEGFGGYGTLLDLSDTTAPNFASTLVVGSPFPAELLLASNLQLSVEDRSRVYGHTVATTSTAYGAGWANHPLRKNQLGRHGVADTLGIIATDARRVGCAIGLLLPKTRVLSRHERARCARLAAHLATGLRLRRTLHASTPVDLTDPVHGADAILSSAGSILHAEPNAVSSREALRRHARSIDRARASMRRSDADGALDTWTAMVEGRWTLIDHFESDGRRLMIARRNDAKVDVPRALTPIERSIASLAALGHPNKIIAYELGLPISTVSTHLADSIAKLGLSSRAELAAAFSALVRLVESEEQRLSPLEQD